MSGDFSVGAEGLLIEGGALGQPVREVTVASYWRLVASAYDDEDELRRWAALGLAAARRTAAIKAAKGKGAKAKTAAKPPVKATKRPSRARPAAGSPGRLQRRH